MEKKLNPNSQDHQNVDLSFNNNTNDLNVNNLNKKYAINDNNNSKENIELDVRFSSNQTKNSNDNNKSKQVKQNSHKIDKLLDFNLKFESNQLERAYNKSYLAVTRLVFLKYLLFLILFSIFWLAYLSFNLNNVSPGNNSPYKIENYVFLNKNKNSYDDGVNSNLVQLNDLNVDTQYNDLNRLAFTVNHINEEEKNSKNNKADVFIIAYLSGITVIFLLIFAFVLMIEIKETRYRRLEKEIQKNDLEKKVDTKKAERDLKVAMEEIINKDKENVEFKKKLKSKHKNVAKLRNLYSKMAYAISIGIVILMYLLCILPFIFSTTSLTFISHFIWFCVATLLIYLIYPFQMIISLVVGLIMSTLFEVFSIKKQINQNKLEEFVTDNMTFNSVYLNSQILIFVFIKFLLHASLHLIACYLKLSLQGIKRETFLKVAHIHKAHLTAQQDKDITERMIKSIMPPLFTHVFGKPEEFKKSVNCVHQMRPLFIYPVNEVSILFADIVGFTRMSSTKTAEQLVRLLNDLYGRFDKLCEEAGCEKISTLGDCYYCVSGCLNGHKDHAKCCVEMGLLMVKEIELFNKAHNVDVNMRVGVHTGNALCGFIGGKRFRFDVWSGDVTLANKMESSGRPGWVHISEDTYKHLDGKYNTEIGEKYSGKSTYFVIRETKRETVADAMKQFASYDVENNSSSQNNVNNANDESNNIAKKEDEKEIFTKSQDELFNDNDKNSDNLLLMAVKDVQFFKPDFNFLTMRFGKEQENKYQSYLVGSNDNTKSNVSSTVASYWTKSENSLFLSILISFIINLFVSTAYFLSFVVSSMSSFDYKLTSSYRQNFVLIVALYCIIILVQSIFLIFSLVKCTRQANKRESDENNKELNESMLRDNENGIDENAYPGYSVGYKSINNRKNNRKKFIKFVLIHFVSIILLSLVPLFILTTSLPVITNILSNSWSFLFSVENLINKFIAEKLNSIGNLIYLNDGSKKINLFSIYSFMTYIIALIHFGSFIQLSSLFKTLVCFLFAFLYSFIALIGIFDDNFNQNTINLVKLINSTYNLKNQVNEFTLNENRNLTNNPILLLNSNGFPLSKIVQKTFSLYSYLFINRHISDNFFIILDSFLLILFIWILNRQVELIQRLSFKHDQDAHLRVAYAREQKELASWLIDVVLPAHVVDHVKDKKQYSRNYNCVGVLFVSLCNFWEFFEESYEGGRELLRVLNEITVDFDRLFDEPKYKNVEKIKSIGSTFMIGSGLNPDESANDSNGTKHLYDLMDFALELNEKLEAFNNEAMSVCHFKFQMRMGLNCGPVTAGVIGTERLLYDIWGDTVNVASRMDSTGQPGFLQTPKEVVDILKDSYKFYERGVVQIKGKDQMVTYFLNPKENKKTNI